MRIVVVGCGPKALAIYAKAKGLREAGFTVPEICILEKSQIGANWTGDSHGFTDGDQPLGTPPEKDIGFPYDSEYKDWGAPDIDEYVFEYSWPSYKIACREYADWLDRGRPAPRHRNWANYLQWTARRLQLVFAKGDATEGLLHGTLHTVRKHDQQWMVQYKVEGELHKSIKEIACDAIVFTGPGQPKLIDQDGDSRNILNGEDFWDIRILDSIRYRFRGQPLRIAVIGAGETAASITSVLWKMVESDKWGIDIISRRGTLYTRGEGYHENRHFSNPANWKGLHVSLREELIERTDRGVLSRKAMELITEATNVSFRQGEVIELSRYGKKVRVLLKQQTEDESDPKETTEDYDYVIVALGFDSLSFCEYFQETDLGPVFADFQQKRRNKQFFAECSNTITPELSVRDLEPKLYLPMLSGLTQGPGFPNLSCLGLLSDRILRHSIGVLNPERVKKNQ